jgi:FKBP-type peptidyl-prolyl cis-trans isomerase FkpA
MKYPFIIILFIVAFLSSCFQPVQEDLPDLSVERNKKKEAFIKLNRYVARKNQDLIERFLERTGWKMKKTETGLWYEIYSIGKGKPVIKDCIVWYSYNSTLLDGTFCDSVSVEKPKTIKVGQGRVESGLEEALLLLKVGDRARFIIPPHLAYGNFGDGAKIPPGAIIIYDVYLIGLK